MSRIAWASAWVPTAEATAQNLSPIFFGERGVTLKNAIALPVDTNSIEIPDRRAYRSMTRAAVLLSGLCLEGKTELARFTSNNPFSVGVYSAIDGSFVDYPTTYELGQTPREKFASRYKEIRTPKMYLKQLPNLAGAQMGIFLGLQGPLFVFDNGFEGGNQALEQAEADLADGVVEAALVCTAFSFEDTLQALRARREAPEGASLCEGAAAILLEAGPGSGCENFASRGDEDALLKNRYFGISQPIVERAVNYARRQKHEQGTRDSDQSSNRDSGRAQHAGIAGNP